MEKNAGPSDSTYDSAGTARLVWRECGKYVTISGSEAIFSFSPIDTESLIGALEWNEVAVFRKIRSIMAHLDDADISSTNRSLYLFSASLVVKILSGTGSGRHHIIHGDVRYSPFFEAFKIVSATPESAAYHHSFICKSESYHNTFNALHRRFDRNTSAVNVIDDVKVHGPDETGDLVGESVGADLLICDLFRDSAEKAAQRIRRLYAPAYPNPPDTLMIVKGSSMDGIAVVDVFENRFELPSLRRLSRLCAELEVRCHFIELTDFDRRSLMPFKGPYAVYLLYLSRADRPHLSAAGFKRALDDAGGQSRALAPFDSLRFDQNYSAGTTGAIPLVDGYVEPDWHAWKAERDWDPGRADWSKRRYAHEMDFLSPAMSLLAQPGVDTLRALLQRHGAKGLVSPRLLALIASEKYTQEPAAGLFSILLAFEVAEYEVGRIRYLLSCLCADITDGKRAENLYPTFRPQDCVARALRAAVELMMRAPAFRDKTVLATLPGIVDKVYDLPGADRSRYGAVRAAAEELAKEGP